MTVYKFNSMIRGSKHAGYWIKFPDENLYYLGIFRDRYFKFLHEKLILDQDHFHVTDRINVLYDIC